MKGLLFLCIIPFTTFIEAQVMINSEIRMNWSHQACADSEHCDIHYPIFSHSNKNVADLINQTLAEEFADRDSNDNILQEIFQIYTDAPVYGGLADMDYTISDNSSRLFSLIFELGYNGAYYYSFSDYYNFDLNTGLRMDIIQLFNTRYYIELSRILRADKQAEVKANTAAFNQKGDTEKDVLDAFKEMDDSWIAASEPLDFYVKEKNLYLADDTRKFYPHPMLVYMPTLDTVKIPAADFSSQLTPYGQYIFGLNNKWTAPLEKVQFRGEIDGKYDIKIVFTVNNNKWLNKKNQKINGYYFYENAGKLLYTEGNTDGKTLHLDVYDENYKLFEKFDGTIYHVNGTDMDEPAAPAVISGKWTSLQSNKKLGFYVKESDY